MAATFADFLESARRNPPAVALVLGSGLSEVAARVVCDNRVPFSEVPGLAAAGVLGHRGLLTLGDWAGRRVLLFEGRLHFYEGHSWGQVVHLVEFARELGARTLILTNAAGGIHEALEPGSLMALRDHIEWSRPYAWRTVPEVCGAERPSPYSARLLERMLQAGRLLNRPLLAGVYAKVTGPCYETPAEVRALKRWGADAVGMSTAREIQTGFALGLECAAVSCITNRAAGLGNGAIHHGEVLNAGATLSQRLGDLLEVFLKSGDE